MRVTGRTFGVVIVRAATMAGLLLASGCGSLLGPKTTLGPGSIVRGRGLYNEVINYTSSEQTLDLIVRARYGEPWGMLSVASVTASLRAAATTQAQFGIGASSNFQGNLVPLSVGMAYEENPTISYSPVQGDRYTRNMLAPIGIDVLGLLLSTESAPPRMPSVLVKQMNGLRNSMTGSPESRAAFDDALGLLARLEDAGQAVWISSEDAANPLELVIHGYAPDNTETVRELLGMWGLPKSLARQGRDVVLPVKSGFGSTPAPRLNVQTRSVYDLIEIAAAGVEVPVEDVASGLADARLDERPPPDGLRIRSSRHRPPFDVLVATEIRGWWFYIPANDGPSKFAFKLLQTLITMRLADAAPQSTPTLTIPVGR